MSPNNRPFLCFSLKTCLETIPFFFWSSSFLSISIEFVVSAVLDCPTHRPFQSITFTEPTILMRRMANIFRGNPFLFHTLHFFFPTTIYENHNLMHFRDCIFFSLKSIRFFCRVDRNLGWFLGKGPKYFNRNNSTEMLSNQTDLFAVNQFFERKHFVIYRKKNVIRFSSHLFAFPAKNQCEKLHRNGKQEIFPMIF